MDSESERVAESLQFELLLWNTSSEFPLVNHFDLPGSLSIFGISQDPHMCTFQPIRDESPITLP